MCTAFRILLRVPEADIFRRHRLLHALPRRADRPPHYPRLHRPDLRASYGADDVLHETARASASQEGARRPPDDEYTVEHSPCLGLCDYAPAALASARGEARYGAAEGIGRWLLGEWHGEYFQPAGDDRSGAAQPEAQRRAGDAGSIYGDYRALRRAIRDMTPGRGDRPRWKPPA